MEQKKVTVPDILRMKVAGERITMVTAYDCPFARLLDEAGVDILLVGDSLGMVVQGQDTTLPVTLDEMVYHTRMVARGRKRALVLGDLPFGSYQASPEQAVASAVRLVKEGGAEAVKRERGLDDARAVQAAGAFAVVLECIPLDLAAEITAALAIPTIGIGAGVHCDGQVLVMHDLLGLSTDWTPRFAKRYTELGREVVRAAGEYVAEVKGGRFPTEAQTFAPRAAKAG